MSNTPVQIIPQGTLTALDVAYYTSPANTKTIIKKLTFTNTTGGAVNVGVQLVPNGSSAGSPNAIAYNKSLAAGATWSCPDAENQVLEALSAIHATGAGVSIVASGLQVTS